jgi:hypothetical protein
MARVGAPAGRLDRGVEIRLVTAPRHCSGRSAVRAGIALARHRTYAARNAIHSPVGGPTAAITDQSTSELRANLRARREYAATVSGWRLKSALRNIVEMEDELEARGEPPKPERASQPKGYYTPQRLKMHTVDTPPDDDPTLCYHEDRGDGLPLCGQPLNPWTDEYGVLRDVEWAPHGPGWWTAASARTIPTGMTGPSRWRSRTATRCARCPAGRLR